MTPDQANITTHPSRPRGAGRSHRGATTPPTSCPNGTRRRLSARQLVQAALLATNGLLCLHFSTCLLLVPSQYAIRLHTQCHVRMHKGGGEYNNTCVNHQCCEKWHQEGRQAGRQVATTQQRTVPCASPARQRHCSMSNRRHLRQAPRRRSHHQRWWTERLAHRRDEDVTTITAQTPPTTTTRTRPRVVSLWILNNVRDRDGERRDLNVSFSELTCVDEKFAPGGCIHASTITWLNVSSHDDHLCRTGCITTHPVFESKTLLLAKGWGVARRRRSVPLVNATGPKLCKPTHIQCVISRVDTTKHGAF